MKGAAQSTILLVVSLLFALIICEGALRLYAYLAVDGVESTGPVSAPMASRNLPRIDVAEGVDRNWFDELPAAPVRDPKDIDLEAAALQTEYIRRGHFGPQSFYVWNSAFVASRICDPRDQIFHNLPTAVKVFQPHDKQPHPRYRFPPNRTLPSGLKTNRYGFRGADFPPERSANAIRLAFIGSSETLAVHSFPFSYPEYFGIWLDRWLAANGYPFHVEIINAGREGIDTTDVAAILREEVLPLAPDHVIFYDGANQLYNAQSFAVSNEAFQHFTLEELTKVDRPFPSSWTEHVRLAKIINEVYLRYGESIVDDWRRPNYEFRFPEGVDEHEPNLSNPSLPLGLPVFLRDLKSMTDATRAAGVPFMISAITWLDGSEVTSSNPDQAHIRAHLKALFWPLKPPEIRRLIDFSNRVLRQFAKKSDTGILDIAAQYPLDDKLFFDAYHMNPEGLKLLAWIGLQKFLPQLAQDLRDGKLGKTRAISAEARIPLRDGVEYAPACEPTPAAAASGRALPLRSMIGAQDVLLQQTADGLTFRSTAQPWSHIGRMPLNVACMDGGGWIAADVRVTHGVVGVDILNQNGDDYIVMHAVPADNADRTVFLHLDSFAEAGDLIVRNLGDRVVSEGIVRAVRIILGDGRTVSRCAAPTASGR